MPAILSRRMLLRTLLLLPLAGSLGGCIVASVVDTAFDVAVGTVKVGAAVVGGTVKVAAAGVKAVSGDDEDDKGKTSDSTPATNTQSEGSATTTDAAH